MNATYGRLDIRELDDTLLCHVCGRWYRNLAQHARLAHELSADDYRDLAGLNRTTRLISPGMRERLRAVTAPLIARLRAEGKLTRFDEDSEKFRETKALAVETLREGMAAEGRRHRREAVTADDRHARAERIRARNLAGEQRASGAAISAGLRHAAGMAACQACGKRYQRAQPRQKYCPTCRPLVERRYSRESAARRRQRARGEAAPKRTQPLANAVARPVACARCGATFEALSHRERYCLPCREEREREYGREYAAKRRRGRA